MVVLVFFFFLMLILVFVVGEGVLDLGFCFFVVGVVVVVVVCRWIMALPALGSAQRVGGERRRGRVGPLQPTCHEETRRRSDRPLHQAQQCSAAEVKGSA